MKTRIIIALLFLLTAPIRAVAFPQAEFQSTSAYRNVGLHPSSGGMSGYSRPTGSLSDISAANFDALNSEGGACYAAPRKGRPGDEAIGEYDFHSPVGDTPWLLMAAFLLLFGLYQRKRLKKDHSSFNRL